MPGEGEGGREGGQWEWKSVEEREGKEGGGGHRGRGRGGAGRDKRIMKRLETCVAQSVSRKEEGKDKKMKAAKDEELTRRKSIT